MNCKTLLVKNQMLELNRVVAYLDELGEEWELSVPLVFSLNLVVEEALTNIILYGFDDQLEHTIEIDFKNDLDQLYITFIDDGIAYDPTLKEDPDISLSTEDRQIGGLGIFLIKKIMDKVEYKRKENKNFLILTKNIIV
ncbi:MAG: ATP-binding protein [Mariniphaga sp.]